MSQSPQAQNDPLQYIRDTAAQSTRARDAFIQTQGADLLNACREMGARIERGGKVVIFGNGGSAADAQHMAAEMVGRMLVERRPLPAVALTTDTSNLTAIGNDYGYEFVFLRQVQALVRPEDFVIAISTSGNSKNVLVAVEHCKAMGAFVLGITGGSGGKLKSMANLNLNVAEAHNSSRIQETHIFIVHSLVDCLDRFFLQN
jgi:D-sedoheptulose 7-phosphate isomerase